MLDLWALYAPGLAWLTKMLESAALHDVVPQALLQWPSSPVENLLR
jgi:hypothetical protein